MSLRLLAKLMVALFAGAALVWLGAWFARDQAPAAVMQSEFRQLQELARSTRGTVVRVGGPAIEFVLPPSANTVRILSNANLRDIESARRERLADPGRRWSYVLEVEEIRPDGASTRTVHSVHRELVEVALPGGLTGTGSFYLQSDAPRPLNASTLRLDYAGGSRPSRLRVRLVSADVDISDVLLRVASPEPVTQRSAETMWQRLGDVQRGRLAAGNLYPPDLLIEQERTNLMASRWRPLGPVGEAEGRDIYVLDIDERGPQVEPFRSASQTVGPGRWVVVQLPETGGRLRIELEPVPGEVHQRAEQVSLRWAGHSAFQRSSRTFSWTKGMFSQEVALGGGHLELGASRDATVRVTLLGSGEPKDITPTVRYLRNWTVEPDAPVAFAISHAGELATPLRLVMRRVGPAGAALPHPPVRVTLLGRDDQVLRHLTVDAGPFAPTKHDGLWPRMAGSVLSDPQEAFFRLPKEVRRIRVSAADPLLVVAYSRPLDLPRQVRTPEDSTVPDATASAIPAWFPLQPEGAQERILNGGNRLITVQDRMPEDRPDLAAGSYGWESFTPLNPAAGRVFLAPREEGVPERIEGLPGTFRALSPSGSVTFLSQPGRSTVPARLAWTSDTPQLFNYVVTLDGVPWASGAASGVAGEVLLPSLKPGAHRLEIQAPSAVRWFANYLQSGTPWVKRFAYQFDKPLQFEVARSTVEQEFLSVRLFRPVGQTGRLRVRVNIKAPPAPERVGPFPGWLFSERVHDVRPSGEFALPVAESAGVKTDAGQPFFVPIPKGAAVGRYRVTLTPEGGAGWVSVSRITPNPVPIPQLIVESVRNGD
jgi:hypothetical protein